MGTFTLLPRQRGAGIRPIPQRTTRATVTAQRTTRATVTAQRADLLSDIALCRSAAPTDLRQQQAQRSELRLTAAAPWSVCERSVQQT